MAKNSGKCAKVQALRERVLSSLNEARKHLFGKQNRERIAALGRMDGETKVVILEMHCGKNPVLFEQYVKDAQKCLTLIIARRPFKKLREKCREQFTRVTGIK